MDTRFSDEQEAFAQTVERLAQKLGPKSVESLADTGRRSQLEHAVISSGLLDLRTGDGSGAAAASGIEVGILARAFGRGLVDIGYLGRLLAAEALRLGGYDQPAGGATVALDPAGLGLAVWSGDVATRSLVLDAPGAEVALGLVPDGTRYRLAGTAVPAASRPIDLTRGVGLVEAGAPIRLLPAPPAARGLSDADVGAVETLGQVVVTQDLVGAMEGAQEMTRAYAAERRQYGVTIGSFQAVQHALAESFTLVEGSLSIGLHASWALDHLPPAEARRAADIAKIYCTRAARQVCETAVQIHGGIGNTWECLAHVYLRRVLHSTELFGTGDRALERLSAELLAV